MLTMLTGAVAVLFVLMALGSKRNGAAMGLLIVSLLLWPEYLRVQLGPLAMSAPRLVAVVLLLKFLVNGASDKVRLNLIDGLVVAVWLWTVLATVLLGSEFAQIKEMIGRGLDTVLMYFVARLAFNSPSDAKGLLAGLMFAAFVMGLLGAYEAIFSQSPYQIMRVGIETPWGPGADRAEYRMGLLRAKGSTTVSIYFGMAMMLVLGVLWSMREYTDRKRAYMLAFTAALIGSLSSMSSGPWLGCAALIGLQFFAYHPYLIKRALLFLTILIVFVEVASNRHFYELIDHLALDSRNAWYRTRLIEIAAGHLNEFWLLGVGSSWPHHWGMLLDGRGIIDVVNNFLILTLYGGVPAALMYVGAHAAAVRSAVLAWQSDKTRQRRNLLSGLICTLIALDLTSLSVGLYGPPLLLSYVLLGMIVSVAKDWQTEQEPDGQNSSLKSNLVAAKDGPIFH